MIRDEVARGMGIDPEARAPPAEAGDVVST
jgi:hypothetical protein